MRLRSPKVWVLGGELLLGFIKFNIIILIIEINGMFHIENDICQVAPVELVVDTGANKLVLEIYPDSDPSGLARQLCYKNNLEYKLIPTIADKIKEMMMQHFDMEDR